MSLMIKEGEVRAVGTTDEAAMGYYIVQRKSEPYALQADAEGMSGIVTAGAMMVDGLYFNRVQQAPYWYTQSEEMSNMLEEISETNKLPLACNRLETTQKNAGKISMQKHKTIMEEAARHDMLEYNDDDGSEQDEDEYSDNKEDESESDLEL